jgi:DNA-directed RNA polymerase specialized sigma subunit
VKSLGAGSIDVKAKERRWRTRFPMESETGIRELLENIDYVIAAYLNGDIAACDLLIDLQLGFKKIKITDKQRKIIKLHFFEGLTQEEVAEIVGISQQGVSENINTVIRRLAAFHRGEKT